MIVFIAVSHFFGTKAAIASSMVVIALGIADRVMRKRRFETLFIVSAVQTLVFGGIDLVSDQPFMLRFEAVISNLVTAGVFLGSLFRPTSMVEEIVERQKSRSFSDRPDLRRFFQILTLIWVGYFLLKAMLYLWLGMVLPLEQAMEWRATLGTASLMAMIGLSIVGTKFLYQVLYKLGWLPRRPEGSTPV